jgi:hypothetical protein
MKQQEVFKKIGTILKELNDQYEYLGDSENQLNDLELELFVANAHFLADHSQVLRKLNQQNLSTPEVKEQPAKEPEEKYFEPVVQQVTQVDPGEPAKPAEIEVINSIEEEPPHIDLGVGGADDDFSYIRHEPEIIKHELVLDESQNWDDEDDKGFEIEEVADEAEQAPIIKAEEPEPVKEIKPAEVKQEPTPVTAQKEPIVQEIKHTAVTEEPLTINQMMSAQLHKGGRAAEQLHVQPISDLKQAINLNDKLLYIKDLFNGYNLAYSEAIDLLNRFSSFTEAEDFLKTNYAIKNHWDTKQATADKFYDLLRRRYA